MNIVSIAGNVGREPEMRATQTGEPVLSFSIADNGFGRDTATTWWNCSIFGKRAESLQAFIHKGTRLTVSGQARLRTYTDKNGVERSSLDVRLYDVALQDAKGKSEPQGESYASVKGHAMKRPSDEAWRAVGDYPDPPDMPPPDADDLPF